MAILVAKPLQGEQSMSNDKRWPDDLVDRLAAALWADEISDFIFPSGMPTWEQMTAPPMETTTVTRIRSLAVAALAFLADYEKPEHVLPFRMGYVIGALENDETMKAVYPKTTKDQRKRASDLLVALVNTTT